MEVCIYDVNSAEVENHDKGLNIITIWEFLEHVHARYSTINQTLINQNLTNFKKPIQEDTPLAVYTRKKKIFQIFVAEANLPISEATMVKPGIKHALQCGSMMLSCRDWKRCPENQHTWQIWKSDWTLAFKETRNTNQLTAGNWFSQANLMIEAKLSKKIINSLDNIANASVIRNNIIKL